VGKINHLIDAAGLSRERPPASIGNRSAAD
jgi:hypothetical protein